MRQYRIGRPNPGADALPLSRHSSEAPVEDALEILQRIGWEGALRFVFSSLFRGGRGVCPMELQAGRPLGRDAADFATKDLEPLLGEVRQLGVVADFLANLCKLLAI